MALTISRVDRRPRTYALSDVFGGVESVPADVTGVEVALLRVDSKPTAATAWTSVTYAAGSFDVLWVGPDADSTGGYVVPTSADAWMKITNAPLVQAVKIERITVMGGGPPLNVPTPDAAITALLNDTTSATYARVLELIEARAGFGGLATP